MTTFWSFFAMAAALQGAFLGIVLLFHPRIEKPKRVLIGLLILFFSLWLLEFASYWNKSILRFPHLFLATKPLPWALGPLAYLFTIQLRSNFKKFRSIYLLHFIPALIRFVFYIPIYITGHNEKIQIINEIVYANSSGYSTLFFIIQFLAVIQIGVYAYLIKRGQALIPKPKKIITNTIFTFILLFSIVLLTHLLNLFLFKHKFIYSVGVLLLLCSSVFIYSFSYYIIIKPITILNREKEKYLKTKLSNEKTHQIEEKLLQFILEEKNYLNPSLSVSVISQKLKISTHHISQVVNSRFNCSVTDFINKHRIEDVKEKLLDPKYNHYNIIALANDSGFSTKASFYNTFKKFEGITPTQYREKNQN